MDKLQMRILLNEISETLRHANTVHNIDCMGEFGPCRGCDILHQSVQPMQRRVERAIKELQEDK